MKISISTLPFYPHPLQEILDHIIELDQGYCEIIHEYPHDISDVDMVNSFDIEFSVHAPLSDVNVASHNEGIRRSSISLIKKSMDLAVLMGSDIVVVHPGHMPILGRKIKPKILNFNRDSLQECSKYAQNVGVSMCVENMPDIEGLLFTDLDELSELVDDIDAYMTLDVGHAHNNQFKAEDMLKYPNIKHVHLSDNDGSYDSHQALGSRSGDGINFPALFRGLKKRGYQGFLVVEVEEPGDVKQSIDFLDNNLDKQRTIQI
jgi:sugar phosphate isomerase/epimerase